MTFKSRTAIWAKFNGSGDKKTLLSNFFFLSLLQAANYLLPLLLIPYLYRTIGVDKLGLITYAQAFISYLTITTEYGFNLSATREISLVKTDIHQSAKIFNAVLTTKLVLSSICLFILVFIIFTFPALRNNWLLYLFSYTIVLGHTLFPSWFFQGIEKMKYITLLNVASKLLSFFTILYFVNQPDRYIYVNLLLGCGGIVGGLFSLLIIHKNFKIRISLSSPNEVIQQLKESWHLFLSNFAINIYINSNLIVLGIFASNTVLGYYSIAEKAVMTIRYILVIFSQTIYPQVCRGVQEGFNKVTNILKSTFIPFSALIIIACISLFLLADFVVYIIAGSYVKEIIYLVRILSVVPFIVLINIPAYQVLLAYNLKKSYTNILIAGSVLSLVLNYFLARHFLATGTAVSVIITETFITTGLYLVLKVKHPKQSIL